MSCNPTNQDAVLSFAMGNFPDGYCPSNYQAFANDIANALSGTLPGNFTAWTVASEDPSPPPPNEFAKPWLKLDPDTCGPMGVYVWSAFFGAWVARHPDFPGKVIMYEGLEDDVPTLDGGDINTAGPAGGPMWEIVTEMAAKFPMGPGSLPGYQATPVPTAIVVGGDGGSEGMAVTLAQANLPPHSHDITAEGGGVTAPSEAGRFGSITWHDTDAATTIGRTRTHVNAADAVTPINIPNLPPYRGIWFLRKTARIYYKA